MIAFYFLLHNTSYGMLVPQPGIRLMPPAWICRALTTGPPEVPSDSFLINVRTTPEVSAMYLGYLAPLWLLLSLIC